MSTTSYFRSAAILSLILVGSLSATAAPPQAKRKIITHVRFVRIELPGENKILSLAEVQVVRGGRNIAPNGVASQSGAEQGALAGRAIDSNTSGNFNEGTVTHTPASENPWWELDLGKPQSVESITVWNRTDCCPERLEGFTIKLLDGRRKLLHERKGLRAPRPRTDYLVTGEARAFVDGVPIEDVDMSAERRQGLQAGINRAIERGARYLMDTQLRDGSWGEHTPKYRAGQTALSVYTLVKCGVPRTDPSVRMGLRYLQENPPTMTYSIGIALMLYETLADEGLRDEIQRLRDRLIETQIHGGVNGGLWGYPSGCDLSNTQYAALGLLASHRAGLKVPARVFLELLDGTLRNQEEPQIVNVKRPVGQTSSGEIRMAGFCYRVNENATLTMTTAGISIIAICQMGLEDGKGKPRVDKLGAQTLDAAVAGNRMGLEWLDRHFSVSGGGKWKYYYLYGLERVGALLTVDYIGGKNWYWEGSEFIVKAQGGEGKWDGPTHSCFALLFLSRATARAVVTGSLVKTGEDVRISKGADVDIQWLATGTNPVTMWITGFNEDLIKQFSDQDALVKGLRIARVDYLCDGKVIKTIPVDPNQGWAGNRFAAQHSFTGAGTYRMEVQVRLVDPAASAGSGEIEFLSMPLDVYVRSEFSESAIEAATGARVTNLLGSRGMTATTSSSLNDKTPVTLAYDGAQGTNWLTAKDDALPTLTFNFEKAPRANTLVLSDANSSILGREIYDRPTRIEVNINSQRKPKYVEISDGVLSNWTLSFKTTRIRTIGIRILERDPGKAQPGIMGFSEVELRFDR